jgi:anti-sigma factor RsiW
MKRGAAMTCCQYVEKLGDFIDADLLQAEKQRMELHKAGCSDCRAYHDSYVATIRLVKRAFESGGPSSHSRLPDALVDSILMHRPRRQT